MNCSQYVIIIQLYHEGLTKGQGPGLVNVLWAERKTTSFLLWMRAKRPPQYSASRAYEYESVIHAHVAHALHPVSRVDGQARRFPARDPSGYVLRPTPLGCPRPLHPSEFSDRVSGTHAPTSIDRPTAVHVGYTSRVSGTHAPTDRPDRVSGTHAPTDRCRLHKLSFRDRLTDIWRHMHRPCRLHKLSFRDPLFGNRVRYIRYKS
jgi:hypothetical protein